MSSVAKFFTSKQRQAFLPVFISAYGKETQSDKLRKYCSHSESQDQRQLSFKERLIRKHIFPKDHEALLLKAIFPEPKELFDDVFKPIVESDRSKSPFLYLDRAFGRNIIKARLQLYWPHTIKVTGSHVNEGRAIENVYLVACNLLKDMGFIQKVDEKCSPMKPEIILKLLESFAEMAPGKTNDLFKNVNTLECRQDQESVWQSTLQLDWPINCVTISEAGKMSVAFHEVCLLTAMHLKARGYLDHDNQLKNAVVMSMKSEENQFENFEPDVEIYTDASKVGMGAYILFSGDDTVRWISDFWSKTLYFDPQKNTCLTEFYALVTAVFTWKHKLKNKKVLCYSDNMHAVNLINKGFLIIKDTRKKNIDRKFEKLYKTIHETCKINNITLVGKHVLRSDNVPADLLSKNKVRAFQRIVPKANPIAKKSKKLEFCKPKDDDLNLPKDTEK